MNTAEERFQNLFHPGLPAQAAEILVFSEEKSSRLNYTLDFVFETVCCCRYRLTHSEAEFRAFDGPKLNYSNRFFEGALQIRPEGLLTERGLRKQKILCRAENGDIIMFECSGSETGPAFTYDLLALVFFFISRYEEWTEAEKDPHGRFPADKSLLQQHGLACVPLVDLRLQFLKSKLLAAFPALKFPQRKASLVSTIDVDNLYAFKGKPIWRSAGASLRDLLQGEFKQVIQRYRVLKGAQADPFDIYDEVPAYCRGEQIPLIVFFLYTKGSVYDRSIPAGDKAFKDVFSRLKTYPCKLGLHPSYYSSSREKLLVQESRQFRADAGLKQLWSRQHFLRLDIKTTPAQLLSAGIELDFSMGWSDRPGFRAGTAFPFRYFDFRDESVSELRFVPFCLMDGAYSIHRASGREYLLEDALKMAEHVKACGSYFITVYHERSFYDHLYPGFGTLYKDLHNAVKSLFEG